MIPPELRHFAETMFVMAGGPDPSAWPHKVELGLYVVIVGALLGLVALGIAWRRTG